MKKKSLIFVIGIAALIVAIIFYSSGAEGKYEGREITIYKSPTCGCCVQYMPYLEKEGFKINTQSTKDMNSIKERYGIPKSMESCHTTLIGDYFVEGHVPTEVIDKLLIERQDIDGISLPAMPSGSPGMPGPKRGDFIIYSIKDGEVSEYLRV